MEWSLFSVNLQNKKTVHLIKTIFFDLYSIVITMNQTKSNLIQIRHCQDFFANNMLYHVLEQFLDSKNPAIVHLIVALTIPHQDWSSFQTTTNQHVTNPLTHYLAMKPSRHHTNKQHGH